MAQFSHLHVSVAHLEGATEWFRRILEVPVTYSDDDMAVVDFFGTEVVLDQADKDARVSLAIRVEDCDREFLHLKAKGVSVIDSPADQPRGVRTAYLQGPGGIVVELEQLLPA